MLVLTQSVSPKHALNSSIKLQNLLTMETFVLIMVQTKTKLNHLIKCLLVLLRMLELGNVLGAFELLIVPYSKKPKIASMSHQTLMEGLS